MKNTDRAYIGGLIDGEGCISICRREHKQKDLWLKVKELNKRVSQGGASAQMKVRIYKKGDLHYEPKKSNSTD